jgi:hypothetical protein
MADLQRGRDRAARSFVHARSIELERAHLDSNAARSQVAASSLHGREVPESSSGGAKPHQGERLRLKLQIITPPEV